MFWPRSGYNHVDTEILKNKVFKHTSHNVYCYVVFGGSFTFCFLHIFFYHNNKMPSAAVLFQRQFLNM